MNIALTIIHLFCGALAGIAAGLQMKSIDSKYGWGPLGNAIAGIVGGGLVAYVYSTLSSVGRAANAGGINLITIFFAVIAGSMGGIAAVVLSGIIKSRIAKA